MTESLKLIQLFRHAGVTCRRPRRHLEALLYKTVLINRKYWAGMKKELSSTDPSSFLLNNEEDEIFEKSIDRKLERTKLVIIVENPKY